MATKTRLALVGLWVAIGIGVTFATACSSPETLQKAIIKKGDIEIAWGLELELAKNYERYPDDDQPGFRFLAGTSSVLVVAPHATAHDRPNIKPLKSADAGTGSLALMLHKLAGTPVLYTTHRMRRDPNFYDDNEFKRELKKIVQTLKPTIVLDLHGAHWHRPFDVDFGTMNGKSLHGREDLLEELHTILAKEGLGGFSSNYFAASKNQTVTKWVSGLGIPCIQCEFSLTVLLTPNDNRLNEGAKRTCSCKNCDCGKRVTVDRFTKPVGRGEWIQSHRFAQLLQGLVRFARHVDSES